MKQKDMIGIRLVLRAFLKSVCSLTLFISCSIQSQKQDCYIIFDFDRYQNHETRKAVKAISKSVTFEQDDYYTFYMENFDSPLMRITCFKPENIRKKDIERILKKTDSNVVEFKKFDEVSTQSMLLASQYYDYFLLERVSEREYKIYKVDEIFIQGMTTE